MRRYLFLNSLDGVDVADEEAVGVQVGGSRHEIFGSEPCACGHMQEAKRAGAEKQTVDGGQRTAVTSNR